MMSLNAANCPSTNLPHTTINSFAFSVLFIAMGQMLGHIGNKDLRQQRQAVEPSCKLRLDQAYRAITRRCKSGGRLQVAW
jgi:hypothetical protein